MQILNIEMLRKVDISVGFCYNKSKSNERQIENV